MPDYNFNFETTANVEDNILVEEEFDIPISVSIGDLSVNITSNCNNRSHKIIVSINNNNIIDALVNDCNDLSVDLDISVSPGLNNIKLLCDGFDHNEIVKGKGKVNYNISFPFDSTSPIEEYIINLEDPSINSTKQIIKNKIKQLTNLTGY
jgi:hypothetical protein